MTWKQEIVDIASSLQDFECLTEIVTVLQFSVHEKENIFSRLFKRKKKENHLRSRSLKFLLSQAYIITVTEKENFYDNILKTLTSVILKIQQRNAFAVWQIKEIQKICQVSKNSLSWSIKQDNLL